MKSLQKYFVFGVFMTAGLIFAGCGETATDSGTGSSESTTPASDTESTEKAGNASTMISEDFQLVSLNVPNMT